MSQPDDGDEGRQSRPEVKAEELVAAKDTLSFGGTPVKSKTLEVMEECERAGKAAPSVFSGAKSGAETVFMKPPARRLKK